MPLKVSGAEKSMPYSVSTNVKIMKRSGVIPSQFFILTDHVTFDIGLLLTTAAASSLRLIRGMEIEKHSSITLVVCSNYSPA